MKRNIISLLLILSFQAYCQPVDSLKPVIDISLDKMQEFSLRRSEIDWVAFRNMVYNETKDVSNLDTLLNKFPAFFEYLEDFHGGVQTKNRFITWIDGKPFRKGNYLLDEAIKQIPTLTALRWEDIGYFRVPGGTTKNISYVSQMLLDTLCKINPSSLKGIIIDLRLNTGGNIWFMLPPLASLIGEGAFGGYKYPDREDNDVLFIKDGKPFGNNQYYTFNNQSCDLPSSKLPVVILVGHKTASSAEGLLLAFKGRLNTLIVGEPTAGYTTANSSFEIHQGVTLVLATSYMIDRFGNYYPQGIEPDILVEGGDDFKNLQEDLKIKIAKEWLRKQ